MSENAYRRIRIWVAYDGSNYHGWQFQPESITIEGVLNRTLSDFLNEDIKVIGASRTDAGVHSMGNVAVFDTKSSIPADRFPYALNSLLPDDIKIMMGEEVSPDFHPRKCNTKKTYEYRILNCRFDIPTKSRYTYHVSYDLDVDKMKKAASYMIGEYDFTSFCSSESQAESHIRTIYNVELIKENDEIVVSVTGNGFLYNMVRIIVGTLVDVGRGKINPNDILGIIEAKDRTKAGHTAPAKGLMLANYEFVDELDSN